MYDCISIDKNDFRITIQVNKCLMLMINEFQTLIMCILYTRGRQEDRDHTTLITALSWEGSLDIGAPLGIALFAQSAQAKFNGNLFCVSLSFSHVSTKFKLSEYVPDKERERENGQRDGSLLPYSRLSRPKLLLLLPSSSSVVLTRLSGPRSRPFFVVPRIEPGASESVARNSDH
jgi:hypothetical protein